MNRNNFLKTIVPVLAFPILTFPNIDKKYKDTIEIEFFGKEKFKDEYLDEFMKDCYGLNLNEYEIDFASGQIQDFDCFQDFKRTGDFSDMIFLISFKIYFKDKKIFKKFKTWGNN